jgi:hypothetical protein
MFCSRTFCPHRCFVPTDVLSAGCYVAGRFVPTDILSHGRYVHPDVLSPQTLCPYGRFVHGRFVSGRFVSGRFVSGRFVWALNAHLCKLPVNNFVYTVFEMFIRLSPALLCRLFFSMLFTIFNVFFVYILYIHMYIEHSK